MGAMQMRQRKQHICVWNVGAGCRNDEDSFFLHDRCYWVCPIKTKTMGFDAVMYIYVPIYLLYISISISIYIYIHIYIYMNAGHWPQSAKNICESGQTTLKNRSAKMERWPFLNKQLLQSNLSMLDNLSMWKASMCLCGDGGLVTSRNL